MLSKKQEPQSFPKSPQYCVWNDYFGTYKTAVIYLFIFLNYFFNLSEGRNWRLPLEIYEPFGQLYGKHHGEFAANLPLHRFMHGNF